MVEKGVRDEIYHAVHRYVIVNNKYMKDCDKNKELSYLKYQDISTLQECGMSQKLPLKAFELVEELLQFNNDFIKTYDEVSNIGNFSCN